MGQAEMLVSGPGTGKTTHCIELFRQSLLQSKGGIDSRSFFVLPSREHAERIQNLVLKKGVPGLFNAHILTINELAAHHLSGPAAAMKPTDSLRRSILKDILEGGPDVPPLPTFDEVKSFAGFHALLAELVKEFKSCLLPVEAFEKRCRPLLKSPAFRNKFRDFTLVLKHYEMRLQRMGLREAEDDIADLENSGESGAGPELVIFDGFYHFTRAQLKLLVWMARRAQKTVVTLSVDDRHAAKDTLFGYPLRTRRFLATQGFREIVLSSVNRRASHPALGHLARHVFEPTPPRFNAAAPVNVFSAPSRRVEYEMIAREIRRLHRETDIHFSDVCVILRSLSGQKALIESVFEELGVPATIHERNRLTETGLGGALHRFLRLAADRWKRDDVIALAKSSYFAARIPFVDALEMERAALRAGLIENRKGWEKILSELAGDSAHFLSFLLDSESRMLGARTPLAFRAALEIFLEPLERAARGRVLDEAALRAVRALAASVCRRASGRNDRFDAESAVRELLTAVETGLFSLKTCSRNRVQVYNAVMALPKEYKVVFVTDLLEKTFPQLALEDPLFKDAERRVINGDDPVLEERGWRTAGERYFFYMALTRARQTLYLTHSTHDSDGKPVLPSFFIEEVRRCFAPGVVKTRRKNLSRYLPEEDEWENDPDVARGLAGLISERRCTAEEARALADAFGRSWISRSALERAITWTAPSAGLSAAAKKILSEPSMSFSASSLESFAICPYRHFAEHQLRLTKPPEGLEEAQMGTLLHETLRAYFEGLPESKRKSGAYLEDPVGMEKELAVLFEKKFESMFRNEPLYRRLAWRRSMLAMLRAYVQLELGLSGERRVPERFEYDFGKGGSPPLKFADESGEIRLKGSVDRIDVDAAGENAFVIDYKRSSRRLKEKIKKGDEIQLPLYLLAVSRLLKLNPGGMEHRVLRSGKREDSGVDSSALHALLEETEARIRGLVRRIRSGEIKVEPKDCAFCAYDAVCRVEAKKGRL